jgi:hypothetical protein
MNTEYEVSYFDNYLEKAAAALGKATVYFRATGWNSTADVDAINASWDMYKTILPLDLWTALKSSEHVFMEVENLTDTITFLDDNLPQSQATCTNPVNYIFYALYNDQGQQIATNE